MQAFILEFSKIISLTFPALFSGLALILILKFNFLKTFDNPIDQGVIISEKRLFGDNKTYRGLVTFIFVSVGSCYFLKFLYLHGYHSLLHPIFKNEPMIIGLIYATAYILGELINSFTKRQLGIASGNTTKSKLKSVQYFFDLADGIILIAVVLVITSQVTTSEAIVSAVLGIGVHFGTDILMKKMRLKR